MTYLKLMKKLTQIQLINKEFQAITNPFNQQMKTWLLHYAITQLDLIKSIFNNEIEELKTLLL